MQERKAAGDDPGPAQTPCKEGFWEAVEPRREPLSARWYLPSILLVLTLSVPWYLPASFAERTWSGLPLWTWVTVVCSAGLATLTAWAALAHWRDDDEVGSEDER